MMNKPMRVLFPITVCALGTCSVSAPPSSVTLLRQYSTYKIYKKEGEIRLDLANSTFQYKVSQNAYRCAERYMNEKDWETADQLPNLEEFLWRLDRDHNGTLDSWDIIRIGVNTSLRKELIEMVNETIPGRIEERD